MKVMPISVNQNTNINFLSNGSGCKKTITTYVQKCKDYTKQVVQENPKFCSKVKVMFDKTIKTVDKILDVLT